MKSKENKETENLTQKANDYEYKELLGLIRKYDMDNVDARIICDIVYDYFDNRILF